MLATALVIWALHAPFAASPRTCRESRSRSRDCSDSNGGGGAGGQYLLAALQDNVTNGSFYSAVTGVTPSILGSEYLVVDGDSTLHSSSSNTLTWTGSFFDTNTGLCPNGPDCAATPAVVQKDAYATINKTGAVSQVGTFCSAVQLNYSPNNTQVQLWQVLQSTGTSVIAAYNHFGGLEDLLIFFFANDGSTAVTGRFANFYSAFGGWKYGHPSLVCFSYDLTGTPDIKLYIDGVEVAWSSSFNGTWPTQTATGYSIGQSTSPTGSAMFGSLYTNQRITQAQSLALTRAFFQHQVPAATTGQTLAYTRAGDHFCTNAAETTVARMNANQPCMNANGLDGREALPNIAASSNVLNAGTSSLASEWGINSPATVEWSYTSTNPDADKISPMRSLDVAFSVSGTSPGGALYTSRLFNTPGWYTWSCFVKAPVGVRMFVGAYGDNSNSAYCNHAASSSWVRRSCSVFFGAGSFLVTTIGGGNWNGYANFPTDADTPGIVTGGPINIWGCKIEASQEATPFLARNSQQSSGAAPVDAVSSLAISSFTATRPFETSMLASVNRAPNTVDVLFQQGTAGGIISQYLSGTPTANANPRCTFDDGVTPTTATAATAYTLNVASTLLCKAPATASAIEQCVGASCTAGATLPLTPASTTGTASLFVGSSGSNIRAYVKNLCMGPIGSCAP